MRYILIFLMAFWSFTSFGQDAKTTTVEIKTSAQCEMCQKRIEKAIGTMKGVKKASLDVKSKVLTVTYQTEKVDVAALKTKLANTGYDADDMPADKKAHDKLPDCCQKTSSHNTGGSHH